MRRSAAMFLLIALVWAPGVRGEDEVADRRADRVRAAVPLMRSLLSVPNVAGDAGQVAATVAQAEALFEARGFDVSMLRVETGPPALLAERDVEGAERAILIYLQMDGQPVVPEEWDQADPFEAALKERTADGWATIGWDRLETEWDPEWRVFARSASDARGPVVMFLQALAELEREGLSPSSNLEVIMDFEEELGSPHLAAIVEKHRERFSGVAGLLALDGPMHPSGLPTLAFGARGIATATLVVHGPKTAAHSGNYGNWIPNPALRLAQVLAGMADEDGRVLLPGFYEGVEITEADREALAAVPDDEVAMLRRFGLAKSSGFLDSLQAALQYPTLNIRGLSALWTGAKVRTLIPDRAVAEIDVRLVPSSDPDRLLTLIRDHIVEEGFHLVDGEPTDEDRARHDRLASWTSKVSYGSFRTPVDAPFGQWAAAALRSAHGVDPVRIPMLGGSLPISPFVRALDLPAILVPTVNYDNNQHAPNENLRLGNLADGIATYRALLVQP